MRVLLVNDRLDLEGGAERSMRLTKVLLEEHGHTVELFGSDHGEDLSSYWSRWYSGHFQRKMEQLLDEFKPDLVHANSVSRIISPSPLLAAKRRSIPVLMTLRDPHLCCARSWGITHGGEVCPKFSYRCLFRCQGDSSLPLGFIKYLKVSLHRSILSSCCAHFIAPSRALRQMAIRNLGITPESISYLPNFIVVNQTTAGNKVEPLVGRLLIVARLGREKGIATAIRALDTVLKKAPHLPLKLMIAGAGPARTELHRLSVHLGVSERVEFLGRLNSERVRQEFQLAQTAIIPSLWFENNPRVGLEAMQYERPLIVSDRGGLPELIENEISGLSFPANDSDALAVCLRQIVQNPDWAATLGRAGYVRLQRLFGPTQHYSGLIAIYNKLANSSNSNS